MWLTGLVAPWHVGSSQTRARTRVPCIDRQILNHCATREAPEGGFLTTAPPEKSLLPVLFFFFFKGTLFIYFFFNLFWLCWVFVSVRGLSLVVASRGHSSLWCVGLSLLRPLLLRSTSSRRAGSVVVAHGPRCSAACGIFPDQGSNPCPLHWQASSQPLRHQGNPLLPILDYMKYSRLWRHLNFWLGVTLKEYLL